MNGFSDNISKAFDALDAIPAGLNTELATKIRAESLEAAKGLGLPGPRDELWKYTNVSNLNSTSFQLADDGTALNSNDIPLSAFASHRLVFVDGRLSDELSSTKTLPSEVEIKSFSSLVDEDPASLTASLSTDDKSANVFAHINTSFVRDFVFIEIPDGFQAPSLEILFLETGRGELNCPRLVIEVGKNSRIEIIETHSATQKSQCLTNAVTRINARQGAVVTHYRLQLDQSAHHIGNVELNAGADSRISTYSFALGGELTRVDINGALHEPGGHIDMFGLFVAKGAQHIDHHTRINHLAAHTTSNENFKGIADDGGRGVFNGKIYVEQDAQKISANQSSKNLLLSNDAEIDTKPELEIYADDVQCAHGATVGQLREDEMFYLRARGIDKATARTMLTIAFAAEVFEEIQNDAIRDAVEQRVRELILPT